MQKEKLSGQRSQQYRFSSGNTSLSLSLHQTPAQLFLPLSTLGKRNTAEYYIWRVSQAAQMVRVLFITSTCSFDTLTKFTKHFHKSYLTWADDSTNIILQREKLRLGHLGRSIQGPTAWTRALAPILKLSLRHQGTCSAILSPPGPWHSRSSALLGPGSCLPTGSPCCSSHSAHRKKSSRLFLWKRVSWWAGGASHPREKEKSQIKTNESPIPCLMTLQECLASGSPTRPT